MTQFLIGGLVVLGVFIVATGVTTFVGRQFYKLGLETGRDERATTRSDGEGELPDPEEFAAEVMDRMERRAGETSGRHAAVTPPVEHDGGMEEPEAWTARAESMVSWPSGDTDQFKAVPSA
jgi:hypothetical protein